jgi:hypothetical protein
MGKLEVFRKAAAARRAKLVATFEDEGNRNAAATILGGVSAGALSGAGLSISLGEDLEVGLGAPVGLYLMTMGKGLHKNAQANGAGMLAFEAGKFVETYVDGMLAASDDT